ncbi:uncharacterized protein LOC112591486 [Melanaphis sacchari]|uniref:uncharacterized protein LOC112591486 n=1 Tax=Melanaphis sacchari TaxID=742174 RepID=UPI000DC1492E|nr:uncharacterized protein LOC112591486 [Melanaphis sacchari]
MHLIFFKGSCQTIFEAESVKNGIVTLAYLFDVTDNQHPGINHITTYLNSVRTSGQTSRIPVFPLSHVIHNQPVEYFTYSGKIDKRGCECSVTQWIVFTKTSEVNREQMNQFHSMLNKHGRAINRNYRKANPVPAGIKIRPFLVMLNGFHSDSSTDGDVTSAAALQAVVCRSRSDKRTQTSGRRSLTVITSVGGGCNSRWPLSVKSNKTQLLRRMFNLNKLSVHSVHNYWPPTTKTIALNNRKSFEHAQRATDAKTKNNLRPSSLSLVNATRPSWK